MRIEALDAALPQTQCTRCGYDDCRRYAVAMADGGATTNRCPPGGEDGVRRLSAILVTPPLPLDPACGREAPRQLAVIDENWCIGCALCLAACPVDAIAGAPKRMHTVIEAHCTGCELCVPVCPVDCISLIDVTGDRTGWSAWSAAQADVAKRRYGSHQARVAFRGAEPDTNADDGPDVGSGGTDRPEIACQVTDAPARRRAAVANALARARATRKA